uniref:Uncharacterized protein n=1 Tax=Pithovirus LCPAC101 TaxID=2506586 RepID=A0A481Z285_9VIRU|nr:MAG: hypothetical protein LCPAC101_01400 [Pithovirus LCPAC101]
MGCTKSSLHTAAPKSKVITRDYLNKITTDKIQKKFDGLYNKINNAYNNLSQDYIIKKAKKGVYTILLLKYTVTDDENLYPTKKVLSKLNKEHKVNGTCIQFSFRRAESMVSQSHYIYIYHGTNYTYYILTLNYILYFGHKLYIILYFEHGRYFICNIKYYEHRNYIIYYILNMKLYIILYFERGRYFICNIKYYEHRNYILYYII